MPLISYFYGMYIYMYFADHGRAHIHVRYAEYKAKIDIENLEIIKGYLPRRALKLIREWGKSHKTELLENWRLALEEGLHPKKIEPLE